MTDEKYNPLETESVSASQPEEVWTIEGQPAELVIAAEAGRKVVHDPHPLLRRIFEDLSNAGAFRHTNRWRP